LTLKAIFADRNLIPGEILKVIEETPHGSALQRQQADQDGGEMGGSHFVGLPPAAQGAS